MKSICDSLVGVTVLKSCKNPKGEQYLVIQYPYKGDENPVLLSSE